MWSDTELVTLILPSQLKTGDSVSKFSVLRHWRQPERGHCYCVLIRKSLTLHGLPHVHVCSVSRGFMYINVYFIDTWLCHSFLDFSLQNINNYCTGWVLSGRFILKLKQVLTGYRNQYKSTIIKCIDNFWFIGLFSMNPLKLLIHLT